MNKEILFRGKRVDNDEWVFGDLIASKNKYYIHPQGNSFQVDGVLSRLIVLHEVKSETVGQYTGLTDKNGKKIFTGDIIRYGFDIPNDKFVDLEKVYAAARPHDRELGLRPRDVIDALKALNGMDYYGGGYRAVFEIKENNKEAFIIRAKNEDITNEQLILPVRLGD